MRLALVIVFLELLTAVLGGADLVVGAAGERVRGSLAEVEARQVVIVPGAGLRAPGEPGGILARRLACAREVFAAGKARHVLVSGDNGEVGYDEPTAMQRWLVARGVPEAAISRDHAGFRTRDTMERAARVFGVESAIVCTQGLHARRTAFLAVDAGIDAVVLVADGDQYLSLGARLRERVAIVGAAWDALVGTEPRFLGEEIALDRR